MAKIQIQPSLAKTQLTAKRGSIMMIQKNTRFPRGWFPLLEKLAHSMSAEQKKEITASDLVREAVYQVWISKLN